MQKTITWENIEIEITYIANWFVDHSGDHSSGMSHLEIRSKEKLPFTETGYKSHFIPISNIEEYGGAEKFVLDWLNDASKSEEWKKTKAESDQYSMF